MAMHAFDGETKFAWGTVFANITYVFSHEYYSELSVSDTSDGKEEEEEGVGQGPQENIKIQTQNQMDNSNRETESKIEILQFRSQARASWMKLTSITRAESS